MWSQVYDPLHNIVLSALLAAVPVVVLLGALGVFHLKAHLAALLGLASSLLISIFEFGMPVQKSLFLRLWQPETMWLSMSREYLVQNADTRTTEAEPISTIFRFRPGNGTQITLADTLRAWLPILTP